MVGLSPQSAAFLSEKLSCVVDYQYRRQESDDEKNVRVSGSICKPGTSEEHVKA